MCKVPAGVVLFPKLSERALENRAWTQSHLYSDQANYKPSLYVLTAMILNSKSNGKYLVAEDSEQLRRQLRYERRVVDWEINQRTEAINELISRFNEDVIQFTAALDFTRMPVEMRLEPFSETLPEETVWEDHVVDEWKRVTRMVMERPGEVLIVRSLLPNGPYKHTHLSALFMSVEEGGDRRLAGNTASRIQEVDSESG